MAFSITDFKANMTKGGARSNLFEIEITRPGLENLKFYAKAAAMPGSVIGQIDVPYFGRTVKVAGDRTFENWNITVLNQEEMGEHKTVEAWMHTMNSYGDNLDTNSSVADYKTDAKVMHYDKYGNITRTYKFIGMFPINLGQIELAWDSNDAIEEFTVEFAFDYYESDDLV